MPRKRYGPQGQLTRGFALGKNMNAIAGILIGIANESWTGYLLAPLVWGLVWCAYVSFRHRERLKDYISGGLEKTSRKESELIRAFYLTEYGTAVTTSLFFSILVAIAKLVF